MDADNKNRELPSYYIILDKRFRIVIRALMILYIISLLIGIIMPSKQLYNEAVQQASQLFSVKLPLLFFNILYNNFAVIFIVLSSSILVIPGIMLLIENAYLTGTFMSMHVKYVNINNAINFVISALLPIALEALALVYAASIGLVIVVEIIWKRKYNKLEYSVLYMLPKILAMSLAVFMASILAVL